MISAFSSTDPKQREEEAKALCAAMANCPLYGKPVDSLEASTLSGGLTNTLLRIKVRQDKSNNSSNTGSVVVRMYGEETERFISRDAELFWQAGFLKTYHKMENGLAYEFLDNHTPLQPSELEKYKEQIARDLAIFHVQAQIRGMSELPYATEENHLQHNLRAWFKIAVEQAEKFDNTTDRKEKYAALNLADLERHVMEMCDLLARRRREDESTSSPLSLALGDLLPEVPCHNDLLCLNIMRNNTTGWLRFIDFEYMRRNYAYFDIANHFCEYAGFDLEFDKYPSPQVQKEFVTTYLKTLWERTMPMQQGQFSTVSAQQGPQVAQLEHDQNELNARIQRRLETEVPKVVAMVNYLSCASNLLWGIWAVIQAAFSKIDFDFLDYAKKRIDRCLEELPRYLKELEVALL